ncbi:ribose-phosphate diphosphokinase [Stygiolobus caldivivus]|uniref:Ribose-phosphate pyrophosphokinase n=1 Tax=Stygiolobus caldivivus TaxID=2824673 RepID=A0A8D5U615_9CREN|nr:ribose-phosphate diphosphokinase [Stygiolobus caldivivus]BCU70240.1 ribose-phosphate pyrophosphokinase [Stygiolobus caldivivus]
MIIIGGTATNGIDERVSRLLNLKLIKVEHKVFPDGESYIRIPEQINDKEVVLIQSLYPPQDKHLVDLFLMIETLADMKIEKINVVAPYLAYSRQNRRFKEGEAVSVKTVLNLIRKSGATSLAVVEPHHYEELEYFDGETRVIDPIPDIGKVISEKTKGPLVLAPDKGALNRAKRLAEILNTDYMFIEKERDLNTGEVRVKNLPELKVNGRDVVLIDDIISTGGTMVQAISMVKKQGAKNVYVSAVHGLFIGDAYSKLIQAGASEVIITNTIPQDPSKVSVVDVSDAIARTI